MSHKVDPRAYRMRGNNDWMSRGYYKNPSQYVEEDFRIREFLDKKIGSMGVEKIEIERYANKLNIIISTARPGLIIGRGGEGVEQIRKDLEKHVFSKQSFFDIYLDILKKEKSDKKEIKNLKIEIREIKDPWLSAKLSAQWVAQQIEKRMPYRKLLKQSIAKIMSHKEVKGARVEVAGRLNGSEIARREYLASGRLPRQTLRADIDYAKVEALCTYGKIGIKVWIYKGDRFDR